MKIMGQIIELRHQPSGGKEYVALIMGRDPKYTFKRKFLPMSDKKWSSSGKTGVTYFFLEEDGFYEVSEPYAKGKIYLQKEGDQIKEISIKEVIQKVPV